MPFDPLAIVLDLGGRPLGRQLAEQVREAILSGELAPETQLPGAQAWADALGVDRKTVLDGLELLSAEGLILKSRGRPTTVAASRPVRRMATSRYHEEFERMQSGEDAEPSSAFTRDLGIPWSAYTVRTKYTRTIAGEASARLLQLPKGARVLRRYFVEFANGEPIQIRVSVLPLSLVEGSDIEDPQRQPWPSGILGELKALGQPIKDITVVEDIRARRPTMDEARTLKIPDNSTVLEFTRVFETSGGRPVEVSEVVRPADRTTIRVVSRLA